LSQRSTEQRQLIQEILRRADGHLDADEIYQQARQRSPRISLSTVYRNLQVFKDLGLVEEHQFGNRRYYEPAPQTEHQHLVCLSCGRVFEFKCPSTEKLKSRISKEEGFRVTAAEVCLAGYCPACQERLTATDAENRTIYGQKEVK
jgi:Fur family ferric uptake transcriptional regulator